MAGLAGHVRSGMMPISGLGLQELAAFLFYVLEGSFLIPSHHHAGGGRREACEEPPGQRTKAAGLSPGQAQSDSRPKVPLTWMSPLGNRHSL